MRAASSVSCHCQHNSASLFLMAGYLYRDTPCSFLIYGHTWPHVEIYRCPVGIVNLGPYVVQILAALDHIAVKRNSLLFMVRSHALAKYRLLSKRHPFLLHETDSLSSACLNTIAGLPLEVVILHTSDWSISVGTMQPAF